MAIGKRIIELRKKNNLSQKDLANKLFVTDKTISSWETERTEPDIDAIINLSEILNTSISYLINGEVIKNDIETEIKIKLSKKEYENLKILLNNQTNFLTETLHIDTYYKTNKENTYLRIGARGNKSILTYKYKRDSFCDEWEVEIDDASNLDKIFKALGMTSLATVEKVRTCYMYKDKYEIGLDRVKNLGYFIEIEIKKYTKDIEKEYNELLQVAKDLGLNLANRVTKHYLDYFIK